MAHRSTALLCSFGLLFILGSTACLGPQVDDEVPVRGLVLPAGTEVASVADDPALAAQIAALDGVDALVPRISAFADGRSYHYWDFGPTVDTAVPLYYLYDPVSGSFIADSGIIDSVPGDAAYSPFWALFRVPVTPDYAGEVIPSVAALEEAQRLGLVAPFEPTGLYVSCPVVAHDVRMDMGPDRAPLAPSQGYYRGLRVTWFDLAQALGDGPLSLASDRVHVAVGDLYRLRREGGEPLAEPSRGVDMTGDGDTHDTNDIIGPSPDDYMQPRRLVTVTVPAGYASIDTSGDQAVADFRSAADLFTGSDGELVPIPENVVSYQVETGLRSLGVQPAPEAAR